MNHNRTFRQWLTSLLLTAGLLSGTLAFAAQPAPQRDVLREITDVVGLKPRFTLRATTQVENAAAVVAGGQRYLFYNPNFVAAVNRASRTDWAGVSILAHEIGHHLNGHTLQAGGSNPADELEADEFSGFVLRKMGASLAEAQTALAMVSQDYDSPTHPGRSTRLAAINRGWQQASGQIMASARTSAPSAQPVAIRARPAAATSGAQPLSFVGKLTFRDNPAEPLYVTKGLNIVRLDRDDRTAAVVGRLTRSNSSDFPFVLIDGQQRRLYISAQGSILTPQGQQVGRLTDPS